MPEERRHIAILFSDIVGYTSLMGVDESNALDMLDTNRAIHETHIKKFNGTLIKDIGDAILASFNLASDAIRCAIETRKCFLVALKIFNSSRRKSDRNFCVGASELRARCEELICATNIPRYLMASAF